MENIPSDVKSALYKLEEFRAQATPQEQTLLEQQRAQISNEVQNKAVLERQAKLASKLNSSYPALASAMQNHDINQFAADFPAVQNAIGNLQQLDEIEIQIQDLEERKARLEAETEASLAGANAVLEVRNKRQKTSEENSDEEMLLENKRR